MRRNHNWGDGDGSRAREDQNQASRQIRGGRSKGMVGVIIVPDEKSRKLKKRMRFSNDVRSTHHA